ncbi:hypothetical protein Mal64_28670 [Pseudobythopirellula maris]|uniref:Uncharacterized protein n=1 Tax=Pseudobythopirellula maris TaxID=2527991 RepID=A0A5C5ZJ04_9BACT|nr:hypothetical protein [Pseudobythopirellula maris]TWT87329.1 hypothetical protein Mal64_28670 [Pseudobythopirellula maris]
MRSNIARMWLCLAIASLVVGLGLWVGALHRQVAKLEQRLLEARIDSALVGATIAEPAIAPRVEAAMDQLRESLASNSTKRFFLDFHFPADSEIDTGSSVYRAMMIDAIQMRQRFAGSAAIN